MKNCRYESALNCYRTGGDCTEVIDLRESMQRWKEKFLYSWKLQSTDRLPQEGQKRLWQRKGTNLRLPQLVQPPKEGLPQPQAFC